MGILDVDLILDLPWDIFSGWMAYYGVEPWGEERADTRSGIIASVIANVNRDPKKRSKPFSARDFLAFPDPISNQNKRKTDKPMSADTWKFFKQSLIAGRKKVKPPQVQC